MIMVDDHNEDEMLEEKKIRYAVYYTVVCILLWTPTKTTSHARKTFGQNASTEDDRLSASH